LFTPLLHSALATYKSRWDADFLADRKQVFPDVDFDTLEMADPDRCSQVRAYLGAVQAQLALDGSFLGGAQADSWDIHVWGMVWMIYSALPDLVPFVEALPELVAWYQRVEVLGIGVREDVTIEVAWDAIRSGYTQRLPDTLAEEPLSEWLGQAVHVSAGSADRGSVAGRLLAVDHEQVVLAVEPLPGFEAQVWFPRFGYHLSQAG
jgi:hypothetical protein